MSQSATIGGDGIGAPVERSEDRRFVAGKGRYTDDVRPARLLHAFILRSPYAHARIVSLEAAAARAAPGVARVYTATDITALGHFESPFPITNADGSPMFAPARSLLAAGQVRFAGDAVAMIVAETLNEARDAAELIDVVYEALPVIADTAAAAAPDAPLVWAEHGTNVGLDWEHGDVAAAEAAIAKAAHVVRIKLINNRIVVSALEPRAILATFDAGTKSYEVILGAQGAHGVRDTLAPILGVTPDRVRVIIPDVGGSFGMKSAYYGEYPLVAFAARELGRPVKWVADRSESFLSDIQGRDQVTEAALGFDTDLNIIGLHVETIANLGAYASGFGPIVPTVASAGMHTGLYRVPVHGYGVRCVYTNTPPTDAYRGAGRPEASFIIERLMDKAARQFGVPPDVLRRRNFIPVSAMPCTTPTGVAFDSGDFVRVLDEALARADWAGFPMRKAALAREGKLAGIGLSCYVERTPGGTSESAKLTLMPDGHVRLDIGTQSTGQGHETVFAQLVADKLGVPFSRITVVSGRSVALRNGDGTYGSRSLYMAKAAIDAAYDKLCAKAGRDLFAAAHPAGLSAEASVRHDFPTLPNGCHVCEVAIERETGQFQIMRYTAVDDFGVIVNPRIVEGQVHGAVAQGLGQAMGEVAAFDPATGQLVTGSFMDYPMPRADLLPRFSWAAVEIPCRTNPLGVKGCGEAGTVAAPSAFVNAIIDALSECGVTDIDMPVTPLKLFNLLRATDKLV